MSEQLILFETAQEANDDGSFTLRPKKVSLGGEKSAKWVAKFLRMHVQTVYRLCELGEENGGLKAYKMTPSAKGNSAWRVDWASVASYKQRRREQDALDY